MVTLIDAPLADDIKDVIGEAMNDDITAALTALSDTELEAGNAGQRAILAKQIQTVNSPLLFAQLTSVSADIEQSRAADEAGHVTRIDFGRKKRAIPDISDNKADQVMGRFGQSIRAACAEAGISEISTKEFSARGV